MLPYCRHLVRSQSKYECLILFVVILVIEFFVVYCIINFYHLKRLLKFLLLLYNWLFRMLVVMVKHLDLLCRGLCGCIDVCDL